MLSSLNPLTCLDKLTVNSLDSIGERVRLALLHVFLPRLCETCRPAFSETFRLTQSTPVLLKSLCDSCKINYVRDKRAVSRKKTSSTASAHASSAKRPAHEATSEDFCNPQQPVTTPAKPGPKKKIHSQTAGAEASAGSQIHLPNPKKVKLSLSASSSSPHFVESLPISPPPDNEAASQKQCKPVLQPTRPIYEQLHEHGIDWCRYCGVAGDTGTFWKLGPWGDRTLCHKHGCEFLGCGFARATLSRLDLTAFYKEARDCRIRPVVQDFCSGCWERIEEAVEEGFKKCHGCPLSFHASCLKGECHVDALGNWYCSAECESNFSTCIVRPHFPSKARFPFYAPVPQVDIEAVRSGADLFPRITLRLILPAVKKVPRKYRKHGSGETAADRVIAFVPVKVDHSVHLHEDISTPRWLVKSAEERAAYEAAAAPDDYEPEALEDAVLVERHLRYEHAEKTTMLLKPGVLESLASGRQL